MNLQRAGFSKEDAEALVRIMMKKPATVVDTIYAHQQQSEEEKPTMSAAFTFVSFVIFGTTPFFEVTHNLLGVIPLLCDIVLHLANIYLNSFLTACFLTAFTLFFLGSAKVQASYIVH